MGYACLSWHCLLIPCSRLRKRLLLWALRRSDTPAHMSLLGLLQPQLVYDDRGLPYGHARGMDKD